MKKIFLLMVFVVAVAIIWSCKKNVQDATYTGEAAIFLRGPLSGSEWGGSGEYYSNSINFSFANYPSTKIDTVISLTVQVVGDIVDYDRKFAVEVDGSSSALPDEYELVSDFVVPAKSFEGKLGIKLKRAERLSSAIADLRVKLVPTDDFLVNQTITTISHPRPNTTLQTSFLFSWNAELIQPEQWYALNTGLDYFIGGYSKKKHQMIIDLTPYSTEIDLFNTSTAYNNQKYAIQTTLQTYVLKYNTANPNNPLLDEQGRAVVIGRLSDPRP